MMVAICSNALSQVQPVMGVIGGVVSDEDDNVLERVVITLENTQTGFKETLVTDAEGRFLGVLLPLGTYLVTAQLDGFQAWVWSGVELDIGQSVYLRIMLEVI